MNLSKELRGTREVRWPLTTTQGPLCPAPASCPEGPPGFLGAKNLLCMPVSPALPTVPLSLNG